MAFEIIWTQAANDNLRCIVAYLIEEWSEKSADKFVANTLRRIETLRDFPERGRPSPKSPSSRMLKIDRQNFIVYQIGEKEIHIRNIFAYNVEESQDWL